MENIDITDEVLRGLDAHEPEAVMESVRIMYPHREWEISDKAETAYVDDDVNDRLLGLVTNDAVIFDLFSSECGRFTVNPEDQYGISITVADAVKTVNKFE